MDVNELYERGLKLRRQLFGNKAVEYCGIPTANEAHRIAFEIINERLAKE